MYIQLEIFGELVRTVDVGNEVPHASQYLSSQIAATPTALRAFNRLIPSATSKAEDELTRWSRVFWRATTKSSDDRNDLLPQEDSEAVQMSVFNIFSHLFPEVVSSRGSGLRNKLERLHFNRVGYCIYAKQQSRRVPAVNAKPGNPGYAFKQARWRSPIDLQSDGEHCQTLLREAGVSEQRILAVVYLVQDVCTAWDSIRRPRRPAGPGRPRIADTCENAPASIIEKRAVAGADAGTEGSVTKDKTGMAEETKRKFAPSEQAAATCKKSKIQRETASASEVGEKPLTLFPGLEPGCPVS